MSPSITRTINGAAHCGRYRVCHLPSLRSMAAQSRLKRLQETVLRAARHLTRMKRMSTLTSLAPRTRRALLNATIPGQEILMFLHQTDFSDHSLMAEECLLQTEPRRQSQALPARRMNFKTTIPTRKRGLQRGRLELLPLLTSQAPLSHHGPASVVRSPTQYLINEAEVPFSRPEMWRAEGASLSLDSSHRRHENRCSVSTVQRKAQTPPPVSQVGRFGLHSQSPILAGTLALEAIWGPLEARGTLILPLAVLALARLPLRLRNTQKMLFQSPSSRSHRLPSPSRPR